MIFCANKLAGEMGLCCEDAGEHFGFGRAEDVEDGICGVVEGFKGEGEAPCFLLRFDNTTPSINISTARAFTTAQETKYFENIP